MEIKTKKNIAGLKEDVRTIKTRKLMKNMVIKQKQGLRKQSPSNTREEQTEQRYAVEHTEQAAKFVTAAGRKLVLSKTRTAAQRKQFLKRAEKSISKEKTIYDASVNPVMSYIDYNDSMESVQPYKREKEALKRKVRAGQKKQFMAVRKRQIIKEKTGNSGVFDGSSWSLLSAWTTGESGQYLSVRKERNSRGRKTETTFFVALKRKSPLYLALTGFLLVILLIVMVFSSSMAVIGNDDDLADVPADGSIVEVAQSQLGNRGGRPYWSWYGFADHVDWCACFVSWCADRCGYIEKNIFPKFSYCQDGANWFIQKQQWYRKSIRPKPGMIIFFDWDGNGVADHVGIVKSCKDNMVRTIEGNSGDMCKENQYAVGNEMIMGYGMVEV